MATTTKLNDTHLVILGAASERQDRRVLPVPRTVKAKGAALGRVLEVLLKRGLIAERRAGRGDEEFRCDGEGKRLTLVITAAGLAALGVDDKIVEPSDPATRTERPKGKGSPSGMVRDGTKGASIRGLLGRKDGATIAELKEASGWQAHSVRGFLSGTLKKKLGIEVTSEKRKDGERRYRIAS